MTPCGKCVSNFKSDILKDNKKLAIFKSGMDLKAREEAQFVTNYVGCISSVMVMMAAVLTVPPVRKDMD